MMIHINVFLLLLLCLITSTHSSPTNSRLSNYESIRALDESGQSIQLQHASQAALQQGNLILAVKHDNSTIHLISIAQPSVLHTITPTTFLTCSGVQADARWLIETLRSMHQHMQLQYGSTGSHWAQRLAALYRAVFWGVSEENTKWQHVRNIKQWGRPLGVSSILIEGTRLYALEPSGVIVSSNRLAIGKHSPEILRQWPGNDDTLADQLKAACHTILPRGTVLSIQQVGTNDSWQLQL